MSKPIAPKTLENPAMATALSKAIKSEKPIVGSHDAKVAKLIGEAVTAAGTMVAKCREAAKLAAKQFNPEETPYNNVERVTGLYAEDFAGDHNVKAVFKDALWLFAVPKAPITFVKKTKDGEQELHTDAGKAVNMGKHDLREAAKQVREQEGVSRAKGAGRKPNQPTRPTEASKANPEAENGPAVVASADEVFLENLAAYLTDVGMVERIKAVCAEGGFTLAKARAKK